MRGIEIETKLELSESDYQQLRTLGDVEKSVDQLNVYYDWQWTLAGAGCTFRVRFSNGGGPVVTLKVPLSVNGATRTATEIEAPASDLFGARPVMRPPHAFSVEELPKEYATALMVVGISRLCRVGWVRNRRQMICIPGQGSFELDWLQLPDHTTVFELEIEHVGPNTKGLVAFLKRHAPSARASRGSKFDRFVRASSALIS